MIIQSVIIDYGEHVIGQMTAEFSSLHTMTPAVNTKWQTWQENLA
jgi:hypothetical protein